MEEFSGVKRRGMTPYRLHKRAVGENIGDASVKTSRDRVNELFRAVFPGKLPGLRSEV